MSRETLLRLSDTGLTVRDVEFLQLRPDTGPDDWMPALDAGAALGASTFSVVGVDPDRARLTATLARLTADAAPYGIRPTLEPISYQPVSRVADAAAIARAAGAAVLLDALHIQRGGSQPRRRPRAGAVARAVRPDLRRPARHARVPRAARAAAAGHDRRRLRAAGRGPRAARGPRRGRVPARRAARRRAAGHADQRRGPERHAARPGCRRSSSPPATGAGVEALHVA